MLRSLTTLAALTTLGALLLLGCGSPPFWPQFTETLFDSPGDGVCRINVRSGQLHSYSAPIRAQDIPPKAKRTIDELREGSTTVFLAREWGPDGPGYRMEELVRVNNRNEHRSLLVNDEGQVIGRSYEISPTDAPKSLLDRAAADGYGPDTILGASVALGPAGDRGHYRLLIRDPQGRQRILECRADGSMAVWYRVIRARVSSTR